MNTSDMTRMIAEYDHGFQVGRLQARLNRPTPETEEMILSGLHQSFINGYFMGRESQRSHTPRLVGCE